MGPAPRGGAYTYDWIENLLGLDMHSADRVLPEFQHPELGDTIGFGKNTMRLERSEPGHVLAWRSEDGNWVWTFALSANEGKTRLVCRNRFRLPTLGARIGMLPMEPASLVMERKMLRGIKHAPNSEGRRDDRTHELHRRRGAHVGEQIGIDWAAAPFDVEQFRMGMDVELEHGLHDLMTNVTDDDPLVTGKIALAHLNEFSDYYTRLERMEEEAKRDHAGA